MTRTVAEIKEIFMGENRRNPKILILNEEHQKKVSEALAYLGFSVEPRVGFFRDNLTCGIFHGSRFDVYGNKFEEWSGTEVTLDDLQILAEYQKEQLSKEAVFGKAINNEVELLNKEIAELQSKMLNVELFIDITKEGWFDLRTKYREAILKKDTLLKVVSDAQSIWK